MTHVQTARTQGAVAGLRQYIAKNSTFDEGTPQGKALADLLAVGEGLSRSKAKNAVLTAYCQKFLGDDEVSGETKAVVEHKSLRERALALFNGADEDDGVQVVAETPAPKARTRKGALKVGTTFAYTGKSGTTSRWTIVSLDGTTKNSKQPAYLCQRDGAAEPRAWSKAQVARKIADGTISL